MPELWLLVAEVVGDDDVARVPDVDAVGPERARRPPSRFRASGPGTRSRILAHAAPRSAPTRPLGGRRIVGERRVERDPAGVVVLADVVGDREVAVGGPLLGPAAGRDAPAAQLRLVAFLAAVALGDAVVHVPVVREPERDPVAPVVGRRDGGDHDVATRAGHESVPAALEPARLDAGAVDPGRA